MTAASTEKEFAQWWTLREIDTALGQTKGTAFRAFRAQAEGDPAAHRATLWQDGRDYRLFRRHRHPETFDSLAARLYPGSLTAIVVSPAMAAAMGCPAGVGGNDYFP